ncbi:MAG: DegQ family serine endoprotease, partial [Alphaproteobacteria bacterium]|nr:DegQ family serine endoprotease [Alphaproteobacteria bacterium]
MRIVLKLADVTRLIPRALVTMGLVLAATPLSPQMAMAGAGESFAPLVENLLPAVVNISTVQNPRDLRGQAYPQQQVLPPMPFPPGSPFEELFRNFFDQQQQRQQRPVNSLGSGFIIDPSGIVVTNNHVIADADVINVTLQDNTSLKAEIVGRDKKVDLAVLKVKSDKPLPFVRWGNSDAARVGDWILAIGNPFGLGGTVTTGIVSARARDINSGPYDDFIQTDAPINRGNSGGPMFNMQGEVVGINSAIFSPSGGSVGIGFAMPSSLAKPVVEQLQKYGKAKRGWLGVRIQAVTPEIAESLGLAKPRGALVANVSDGGPAAAAKIQAGDVVLTFDNKDISEMRRLPRLVAETAIGKRVDATVWRKGQEVKTHVVVGELPDKEDGEEVGQKAYDKNEGLKAPNPAAARVLGMNLVPLTPEARTRFKLDAEAKGVLIESVAPGGAAAERGLQAGDVVIEVAQQEVAMPQQLADKIKEAQDGGKKSVLLLLNRGGDL